MRKRNRVPVAKPLQGQAQSAQAEKEEEREGEEQKGSLVAFAIGGTLFILALVVVGALLAQIFGAVLLPILGLGALKAAGA